MKILFFGDSIVGMDRQPDNIRSVYHLGKGFVFGVASELARRDAGKYQVINRGNGGDTVTDLYSRIRKDVWAEKLDVLTIHVGINDLYHNVASGWEIDINRYEKTYSLMIEQTLERLPNCRIILSEPFFNKSQTFSDERYEEYKDVFNYSKVVKKLADRYGLEFMPLQDMITELSNKYGDEFVTMDGIHPTLFTSANIAKRWLELFDKK